MSKEDDVFMREFGVILAVLFVFFLFALILARQIGASAYERSQLAPGEVAKRVQPVGSVRYGEAGQMMAAPEPAVQVAAGPAKSGEEVYKTCVACHGTGAAGAPKVGDSAAWNERAAQGLDTMVTNSIQGKGLMPPKGGNPALSDEELTNAIKYMLEKSGVSAN